MHILIDLHYVWFLDLFCAVFLRVIHRFTSSNFEADVAFRSFPLISIVVSHGGVLKGR